MSNPTSKLIVSFLIGLGVAFAFNSLFLDLSIRPFVDQVLLLFVSTISFGYLCFSFLGLRGQVADSQHLKSWTFDNERAISFLRENIAGLLLMAVFFAIYTYIGLKLNPAGIDTVDNFFDADNSSWMVRIAEPNGGGLEMRGPHPFAYFILRPFGWLLNPFTQNWVLSAILLNTFTGGLAVFLAWLFIKDQTENKAYAGLIASMLGLSTAHIFFGSVIETYIFSAAALIGFFSLLQKRGDSIHALVITGLLTFGITLTNFVQSFIGFVISRPRIRDILRFVGLTISFGVVLSLLHAALYPTSRLFFLTSDTQGEVEFQVSLFNDPHWKIAGRVILLARSMLIYTMMAPTPYVFGEEVGGAFPRFNFFRIAPGAYSFSSYEGLGNLLVITWGALLIVASVNFLRDLIRTRRADMRLAFVLCLLFNFILHLNYGYEPFLYSPDWAYALIFFVALSLAPLADSRIFQAGLFIFLILLAYNQFQFFEFVFQTIAPFITQVK